MVDQRLALSPHSRKVLDSNSSVLTGAFLCEVCMFSFSASAPKHVSGWSTWLHTPITHARQKAAAFGLDTLQKKATEIDVAQTVGSYFHGT